MTWPGSGETTLPALLQSTAVQRLRRVSQAGAPALLKPTRSATRWEHSIGVWRLARRLGLPTEHQVTALLHDVTHSAFSHTIDYLVANAREDTHDRQAHRLLRDLELVSLLGPGLLGGIVRDITDKPLWLRTLDAVDYTLRDLRLAGLVDAATADRVVAGLAWRHSQVCFTSVEAAWTFTQLAAMVGAELYLDPVDLFLHQRLAQLLAAGVEAEAVTFDELLACTDPAVLRLLAGNGNLRAALCDLLDVRPANLRGRRDGRAVTSKVRLLDPLVDMRTSELVPLSEITPRWSVQRRAAEQRAETGVPLLTAR